jgi:hypothetical protein
MMTAGPFDYASMPSTETDFLMRAGGQHMSRFRNGFFKSAQTVSKKQDLEQHIGPSSAGTNLINKRSGTDDNEDKDDDMEATITMTDHSQNANLSATLNTPQHGIDER